MDILQTADIIEAMENFLIKRRPPEHIRHKVDLAYKITGQSVFLYEIRPSYKIPDVFVESEIAKTTWVQTQKVWKVFWMRSDLKWHSYTPCPFVKTIYEFSKLVDEDKHACFFG